MKKLIFILLLAALLFSCTTKKQATSSHLKENVNVNNEISKVDEKHLMELTERVFKKIVDEDLSIDIQQTKFDTEKPVDSITRKPPVKERNDIKLSKKTKTQQADSISNKTDSTSITQEYDHSKITTKIEAKTKEKTESGDNMIKKVLMSIGGLVVIGIAIFAYLK